MPQRGIPFLFMRGGTSRGPVFRLSDLPAERELRHRVLLAVMGSPDPRQIDGLGGADPLTSKVVMVAPSERPDCDVDYHFAQVAVDRAFVDTSPSCGNMLATVGPFAVERGLVNATDPVTLVRIFDVNTGMRIEAQVPTPGGVVEYEGDARIDGVPGTAAPVWLWIVDAVGGKTGALLPTGRPREEIAGVEVTLVDAAMPTMLARAEDFGLTGHETRADIPPDHPIFARIEPLRIEAGRRMGLGDVRGLVVPKVALLARPRSGGTIVSRYFTPDRLHAAHAVTGAVAVATATRIPGTVAHELAVPGADGRVVIEHPSGTLTVRLDFDPGPPPRVRAGILRTARKIAEGTVFVPSSVWPPER